MIPPNSAVYLETSALNFLASWHAWSDGKATKIYHDQKGTKFYVSPITIWEILLTKDEDLREKLIFYMQNIGCPKLLKSPGELIIDYINRGMPIVERGDAPHSKSNLAKTWADIATNDRKTFVLDHKRLAQMSALVRTTFKKLARLTSEPTVKLDKFSQEDIEQLLFQNLLKSLKIYSSEKMTSSEKKRFKIAIGLILIVLCDGLSFDDGKDGAVEQFWITRGITNVWDRLVYVLDNYELLIFRGPFAAVSEMAMSQVNQTGKPNRGVFWDVLHSVYLVYTDYFFTADHHFKVIRDKNDHVVFNRVIYLPEVTLKGVKSIGIYRPGYLEL